MKKLALLTVLTFATLVCAVGYSQQVVNLSRNFFDAIDINGGAIDGTTIGATSPSTIAGTSITASDSSLTPRLGLTSSGTAAAPSIYRTTDKDTGLFWLGPNRLAITAKGTQVAVADSTGFHVTGVLDATGGIAGVLALTAASDTIAAWLARDVLIQRRSSVRDSANAAITANTTLLPKSAVDDSSNARTLTTVPLWWTWAYADSIAANDSLTVEIKNQTPLGTVTGIYIKNTTGLSEKVNLILSFVLPSQTANLDSIRFLTWTETTAATNFALATVWDDSLQSNWKALATATSDTLRSATARTARYQGMTGINIKGGTARLKVLITTIADSMFIANPWAYYTMK